MASLPSRKPKPTRHAQSFQDRADLPNTPPLCAYLLRLMVAKRSNLCLSADVQTSAQLLALAEECGDSICVLKTHADIVRDFGERTIQALREVALRKKFLVFEDRKFGDIGSTVQAQYGAGPHHIADWAPITNAHVFPGPAIITALKATAAAAITAYASSSSTEITAGRGGNYFSTRRSDDSSSTTSAGQEDRYPDDHGDREDGEHDDEDDEAHGADAEEESDEDEDEDERDDDDDDRPNPASRKLSASSHTANLASRKASVVSISTTISSSTEYISPPASSGQSPLGFNTSTPSHPAATSNPTATTTTSTATTTNIHHPTTIPPAASLDDPPLARGLLLLAQMSSADNLFTPEYTAACLAMARQHKDFVIGFVAQESLNTAADDNFLTFTPGVNLPPAAAATKPTTTTTAAASSTSSPNQKSTDGLGQQYNSPRHVVQRGCDVVIVGRGILAADDCGAEAERYRREAWAAYLERVGGAGGGGSSVEGVRDVVREVVKGVGSGKGRGKGVSGR